MQRKDENIAQDIRQAILNTTAELSQQLKEMSEKIQQAMERIAAYYYKQNKEILKTHLEHAQLSGRKADEVMPRNISDALEETNRELEKQNHEISRIQERIAALHGEISKNGPLAKMSAEELQRITGELNSLNSILVKNQAERLKHATLIGSDPVLSDPKQIQSYFDQRITPILQENKKLKDEIRAVNKQVEKVEQKVDEARRFKL